MNVTKMELWLIKESKAGVHIYMSQILQPCRPNCCKNTIFLTIAVWIWEFFYATWHHLYINPLDLIGYFYTTSVNIQKFCIQHTDFVLFYDSQDKQQLFSYTALT